MLEDTTGVRLLVLKEILLRDTHRQALRDRSKRMEPYQEKHLSYVMWWTKELKDVSWEEAFRR